MNRQEAVVIYEQGQEAVVSKLLELSGRIEALEKQHRDTSDSAPFMLENRHSGMIPVYEKLPAKKRRRQPGRKAGHPGTQRPVPIQVDDTKEHSLENCPHCNTPLRETLEARERYTEDVPMVKPVVIRHRIHRKYCTRCKKIVEPKIQDALPRSRIGLNVVIVTAYLHYFLNVSLGSIKAWLSTFTTFQIAPGALTQAWAKLAEIARPQYDEIREQAQQSAVLHADETGWRVQGRSWWLWCFTSKNLVYFLINRSRASPVIKKAFGRFFQGILITDFFGAYNKIKALVKRLKRHESELLTFLHHRDVAPDNNHAERQIRGPVNSRKISYGNRSERGSQAQAILMSIFRTYHLRGINPFMALKSSVETWISTGSVAPLASAACLSS